MFDPRQTEDAKAQRANRQRQRNKKPLKLPPIAMRSSDPDDSDAEYLNTGETHTDDA